MKKYELLVKTEVETNGMSVEQIDEQILTENVKCNSVATKQCFDNKKKEYRERLAQLNGLDINARKANAEKSLLERCNDVKLLKKRQRSRQKQEQIATPGINEVKSTPIKVSEYEVEDPLKYEPLYHSDSKYQKVFDDDRIEARIDAIMVNNDYGKLSTV